MHRPIAVCLALLIAAVGPPPAEVDADDPDVLEAREAERRRESETLNLRADATAQEARQLQTELVRLAADLEARERAALAIDVRLTALAVEEAASAESLAGEREALIDILAALQRIELARPPALAANPADAASAARAATLLAALTPEFEARATALRERLDVLAGVRSEIEAEQAAFAVAQIALDERRGDIARTLEERNTLEAELRRGAEAAVADARRLAERAQNLRALIGALENRATRAEPRLKPSEPISGIPGPRLKPSAEAPPPAAVFTPDTLRFADAVGLLRSPAAGAVARSFGEPDREGQISEGLTFATLGQAQVVAPFDAVVEFAREFAGYGLVLILGVGDGYHIVLAGLSAVYAVEGQSVLAGEPVGEMADRRRPPPELYMEFRKGSSPIDPSPWLREAPRGG